MWIILYTVIGTIFSLIVAPILVTIFGKALLFENDLAGFGPLLGIMVFSLLGIAVSFALGVKKQRIEDNQKRKGSKLFLKAVLAFIALTALSSVLLPPVPILNPFALITMPIRSYFSDKRAEKLKNIARQELADSPNFTLSRDGNFAGVGLSPYSDRAYALKNDEILIMERADEPALNYGKIDLTPAVKILADGKIESGFTENLRKSVGNSPAINFVGQLSSGNLMFEYGKRTVIVDTNGLSQTEEIRSPLPLERTHLNNDHPDSVQVRKLLSLGKVELDNGPFSRPLYYILKLSEGAYFLIGSFAMRQHERNYINVAKIQSNGELDPNFLRLE